MFHIVDGTNSEEFDQTVLSKPLILTFTHFPLSYPSRLHQLSQLGCAKESSHQDGSFEYLY